MVEYDEHPSRVSAWRDGEFVVLPDAAVADCTVWVAAEEHSRCSVKWEGLLARRLGRDRALVSAIPFWVYDLNLGDAVVLMESGEGAPVVTRVARDAGNYTFRVIFEQAGDDDLRWQELMVDLEPLDCWFDVREPGYIALSTSAANAQAVADYLEQREQHGKLQFETGRS